MFVDWICNGSLSSCLCAQKVLAEYGNGSAVQLPAVQPPAPPVPPHLQPHPPYRNATPPAAPPPPVYPNGTGTPQPFPYSQTPQPMTGTSYAGYTQSGYPQYPPYGAQQHAPSPSNAAPALPEALANIPEDQKVRVWPLYRQDLASNATCSGYYYEGFIDDPGTNKHVTAR